MSRGNFEPKRGQMSIFALVLITILMQLALAHWSLATLTIKGNHAAWPARDKDYIVANGPNLIRRDEKPGKGKYYLQNECLDYVFEQEEREFLTLETITARVKNQDYWPVIAAQWISVGEQKFYVVDYWRE